MYTKNVSKITLNKNNEGRLSSVLISMGTWHFC